MQDLLSLLADYASTGSGSPSSDLDGSGLVDVNDLLALLSAYGQQTDCGAFCMHRVAPRALF